MAGADAATQASITIPETYNDIAVTQILTGGFEDLTVLQSISIPDSITTINQNAFRGCVSLTSVTIPSSVVFIGKYAFYESGLTNIVFEDIYNWQLENDLEANSSWFTSYNLGINYGFDGSPYRSYRATADIEDGELVVQMLTKNVRLTVYYYYNGELSDTFTTESLGFYTENWIKQ